MPASKLHAPATFSGLAVCLTLCCMMIAPLQAGQWHKDVAIAGFKKVHIYTPTTDSVIGEGKSLLIVLHGCMQPIDNFLTANLAEAADAHGMVIAVPDAANKAGFNCWAYWQDKVSRIEGDYQNLIDLATRLSRDPNRNIDPDQVYITGISSGAVMAMQTGCLAPDVFAGVAPSAGPSIGTSAGGAIKRCEKVSAEDFKAHCERYAGAKKSYFASQISVISHGTEDTTVNTCYNQQNADGFALLYGVSQLASPNTIANGPKHSAEESIWMQRRVSMLWLNNHGHAWSGGAGAFGRFISDASINFADYLGSYFTANNRRVQSSE